MSSGGLFALFVRPASLAIRACRLGHSFCSPSKAITVTASTVAEAPPKALEPHLVHSPSRPPTSFIICIALASNGEPVTIFPTTAAASSSRACWAWTKKLLSVYFSQSGNSEANRQLLKSEAHGVHLLARRSENPVPAGRRQHGWITTARWPSWRPLPNEVTKLQRREFFRIQLPSTAPVSCTLYNYQAAQPLPGKCTTSAWAAVAGAQCPHPGFDIGTIYQHCELDLREYGVIPLVLKVRNQLVRAAPAAHEQRRGGGGVRRTGFACTNPGATLYRSSKSANAAPWVATTEHTVSAPCRPPYTAKQSAARGGMLVTHVPHGCHPSLVIKCPPLQTILAEPAH